MDESATGGFVTREGAVQISEVYGGGGDPRASPLHVDLIGMPPAVIMTAGCDPLRDPGRACAAALARAGIAVTFREAVGNSHGFVTFRAATPPSQDDVAEFFNALGAIIAAESPSAPSFGTRAAAAAPSSVMPVPPPALDLRTS